MKKALFVLLVLLMCLPMIACGDVQTNKDDSHLVTTESEQQFTTEPTEIQSLEAQYRIVRWDRSALTDEGVSSENYYYDYAELQGESPAYQKINAVLYSDAEKFMNKDCSGEEIEEWGYGSGYAYARTKVTHNQDGFFGVEIITDQYLGGNTSHAYFYSFAFDLNTGEMATLTDLVGMDEETLLPEIRRIALEGLQEKHGDMLCEGVEEDINERTLENFDFGINEGQICLYFAKYSVTNGTAGETWIPTGLYVSRSTAQEEWGESGI